MTKILLFRTWISLRPVGQSWSNFMCSITGSEERLHNVLRQTGSKLWCPWQQKPPLTYKGKNGVSTFSRLLLIRSFLHLQVTRTCIISRTSSNFGQIGPLTTELAALIMGNGVSMLARSFFYQIIIKVARNQDRHKSSVEFAFGPNQTTHFGVTCPWVTKFHTFELEYLWSQLANLDLILCVASLGWGKGCIRFWGRLDQNSGFLGNSKPRLTYNGKIYVHTAK